MKIVFFELGERVEIEANEDGVRFRDGFAYCTDTNGGGHVINIDFIDELF